MAQKTLAEEIITIIKAHSNDNPAPTTGTIIRTYEDSNYADVETEDGTHRYIPVIGENTVDTIGVIVYLDGDLNTPLMITAGSGGGTGVDIVTEWETTPSDEKVPSEKLTKDTLNTKISKSDTPGLVKNDGTIDTTTYSTFSGDYDDLTDKPSIPKVFYGKCSTSASTRVKVVTASEDYTLAEGTVLIVTFTNAQTYNATSSNPVQLQVNNNTAVNVVLTGTTTTIRYHWKAGETVMFVYDGTNFAILDDGLATTTYYGFTKLSSSTNSTSESLSATPLAVKNTYDLADSKLSKLQTGQEGKNVVVDNTTGEITFENKPTIPSKLSDLTNDSDFIETSSTAGLVKNDGTIDETSYLSSLPSHNHGSIGNGGTINSTASEVNNIVVTNNSHQIKTISQLPFSVLGVSKVTSWSSTVSDSNVPSEKLVKDTLDDIEDLISDAITYINQ